jgi:hypothetical protein
MHLLDLLILQSARTMIYCNEKQTDHKDVQADVHESKISGQKVEHLSYAPGSRPNEIEFKTYRQAVVIELSRE